MSENDAHSGAGADQIVTNRVRSLSGKLTFPTRFFTSVTLVIPSRAVWKEITTPSPSLAVAGLALVGSLSTSACSFRDSKLAAEADSTTAKSRPTKDRDTDIGHEVAQLDAKMTIPEDNLSVALRPWKGDYDGMLERRMIRILVPYSLTHFFLDGATKRGKVVDMGRELEEYVNRHEKRSTLRVRVVYIPTPRNKLIPWLEEGIGDIAAGNLTITQERSERVSFSSPLIRNINEVVCTAPGVAPLTSVEDLSGQTVYVQATSSYRESLETLKQDFEVRGLNPIEVVLMDEPLEADEILEMVQAGVIPRTIVDQHIAEFWGQVLESLKVYPEIVVGAGRDIAWAFRKGSAKLELRLNAFLTPRRHRTHFGNIVFKRYLQQTSWVRDYGASKGGARLEKMRPLFEKYARMYDLDPLLLISVANQESKLNQSVRSRVGAVGVMQLMPSTGEWLKVGDITELKPNIHGGAKYLRRLMDGVEEAKVTELNRILFALASYNGGQGRIRRLRRETAVRGLNPNVWFDNVELAVARAIGRETVQYVSGIYRLYLALRMVEDRRAEKSDRALDLR